MFPGCMGTLYIYNCSVEYKDGDGYFLSHIGRIDVSNLTLGNMFLVLVRRKYGWISIWDVVFKEGLYYSTKYIEFCNLLTHF